MDGQIWKRKKMLKQKKIGKTVQKDGWPWDETAIAEGRKKKKTDTITFPLFASNFPTPLFFHDSKSKNKQLQSVK